MSRYLLVLGVLAGCATPQAALDAPPAPAPAPAVSLAALAPVPQPDLPEPLRTDGPSVVTTEAAMDHGAHGAMAAVPPHTHDAAPADAPPLARALDAYLSLQDALASGDLAPIPMQATAFADAWALTTEVAPEADPHFWHMRMEQTGAVRARALALAQAGTLADAREAFGHLSAPFVALIQAHGAPAGYDLARFTCGMESALPEGGVWLQRGTEPRNPYAGSAMLACAMDESPLPTMEHGDSPRLGTEADPMDHAGHDG